MTIKIFIDNEASCRYSNACRFENRASCVGYSDSQANCSTFQKRYIEDVMTLQQSTCVADWSICIEHVINPAKHREEADQESKRLVTD
jgi:hypothetical protein